MATIAEMAPSTGMTEKKITRKRLPLLSKLIAFLIVFLAATVSLFFKGGAVAVFASDTVSKERTTYEISFVSTSRYVGRIEADPSLYWMEEFPFTMPNIFFWEDHDLSDTIEDSIVDAMTSWVKGKVLNAREVDLTILCHSNRYFSFVNLFSYNVRQGYIYDYITIDMQTGKRIMLNDLVEINEDFIKHIQNGNIAVYALDASEEVANISIREDIKSIPSDKLLEMLEGCSLTNEEVSDVDGYTLVESIGSLVFRDSFYLRENSIVLMLNRSQYIELFVDDIQDFLKVEKW